MIDRSILKSVEAIGRGFTKPDDDWAPVLFLDTPEGIHIMGIGNFDDAARSRFPAFLRDLFREHRPTAAAFIVSVWYYVINVEELGADAAKKISGIRPSRHPDRREAVQVTICDGATEEVWKANIIRHPDRPPALAPWEMMPQEAEQGGRLGRLLIGAFEDTR